MARSRGLGDVYKRQEFTYLENKKAEEHLMISLILQNLKH
jgi:hypothetical protein